MEHFETNDFETPSNSLPPCEQFTDFAEFDDRWPDCVVCERLEISHDKPGHRTLSVPEVDALRATLIDEAVRRKGEAEGQ